MRTIPLLALLQAKAAHCRAGAQGAEGDGADGCGVRVYLEGWGVVPCTPQLPGNGLSDVPPLFYRSHEVHGTYGNALLAALMEAVNEVRRSHGEKDHRLLSSAGSLLVGKAWLDLAARCPPGEAATFAALAADLGVATAGPSPCWICAHPCAERRRSYRRRCWRRPPCTSLSPHVSRACR